MMFGAPDPPTLRIISQALRIRSVPLLAYVAVALMFVGLGFKVRPRPFTSGRQTFTKAHRLPSSASCPLRPKAAAFAVLLRVIFETNAPGRFWLIWVAAASLDDAGQYRRAGAEQR